MPTSYLFHRLSLLGLAGLLPVFAATAQQPARVERQANGVLIHLPQLNEQAPRTLRLQVVSDKIIHVQASALDTVSTVASLMVVPQTKPVGTWQFKEKKGVGTLTTPALTATVSLTTGELSFA
ncbi:MAG: DUF4968 domain-containing protein, partial [Hymenobacter sp.]